MFAWRAPVTPVSQRTKPLPVDSAHWSVEILLNKVGSVPELSLSWQCIGGVAPVAELSFGPNSRRSPQESNASFWGDISAKNLPDAGEQLALGVGIKV